MYKRQPLPMIIPGRAVQTVIVTNFSVRSITILETLAFASQMCIRDRTNSWNKDCGRRAIIPIKMMNEIPLPIPLSVILSPSHRINILPAAKMMVEAIIKNVQSNEALSDGPVSYTHLYNLYQTDKYTFSY